MGKVCSSLCGRDANIDIGQTLDQLQKLAAGGSLSLPADAHKTKMRQVPLSGKKRSLLIGINYCGTQNELHGCANDVKRMLPLLEKLHFPRDSESQLVLLDEEGAPADKKPTRANIMKAFAWLVQGARKGDALLFHYSGHGGREPAKESSDGFHETLVPLDFETAGMIRDTDLFDALVHDLPGGCRLTCILDSCHSAGALNLPYRFVGKEAELKSALAGEAYSMAMSKNWAEDVAKWKSGTKVDLLKDVGSMGMGLWNLRKQHLASKGGDSSGFKVEEQENVDLHIGDVIAITGCRSDQTSADVGDVSQQFHLRDVGESGAHLVIDKQRTNENSAGAGGALTTGLLEALQEQSTKPLSYLELLEKVRKELASKGFSQVPQVVTSLVIDLKQDFALDTTFVPDEDSKASQTPD